MYQIVSLIEDVLKCDLATAKSSMSSKGYKCNSRPSDDTLIYSDKRGNHVASYDKESEELITHDVSKEKASQRKSDSDKFKTNRYREINKRMNRSRPDNTNSIDATYGI